jgi:putative membrane protein
MASNTSRYWHLSLGVTLAATTTVSILWLWWTNKLNFYINPSYDWFATLMALIGGVGVVVSTIRRSHADNLRRPVKLTTITLGVIAVLMGLSLIVLRPASLSGTTALQRGINAGGLDLTSTITTAGFGATNYSQFDIRDWASVLSQTSQVAFYNGKTADQLVGFIAPTPNHSINVFYVSRFYITCCAMDAQPYGVPVYVAGWAKSYPLNSWVRISGSFKSNPDGKEDDPVILVPTVIAKIPEPQDPYER